MNIFKSSIELTNPILILILEDFKEKWLTSFDRILVILEAKKKIKKTNKYQCIVNILRNSINTAWTIINQIYINRIDINDVCQSVDVSSFDLDNIDPNNVINRDHIPKKRKKRRK